MNANKNINKKEESELPMIGAEIREHYSNFVLKKALNQSQEYECISNSRCKKCLYNCYIFRLKKKSLKRIEELEEILNEISNTSNKKKHFQTYIDYLIKLSKTHVQIETVREVNSKEFLNLSPFELSIFYFHLRGHIRDIIIALMFLKSRFIGDPRWLNLQNLHFDSKENQIRLCNYLFIGSNYNFSNDQRFGNFVPEPKLDAIKDKGT
jgi:hypothetical protein